MIKVMVICQSCADLFKRVYIVTDGLDHRKQKCANCGKATWCTTVKIQKPDRPKNYQ